MITQSIQYIYIYKTSIFFNNLIGIMGNEYLRLQLSSSEWQSLTTSHKELKVIQASLPASDVHLYSFERHTKI